MIGTFRMVFLLINKYNDDAANKEKDTVRKMTNEIVKIIPLKLRVIRFIVHSSNEPR